MAKGTLQIAHDKLLLENLELKERIKDLESENKRLQNDHNCVASLCDSIDEFGEPMKDTKWTNLGERIYEIVVELYNKIKALETENNEIRQCRCCEAKERIKALEALRDTVSVSCHPPKDCSDPKVLKKYMRGCFDEASKLY